jgi:flagellar basal-body rod protein FlgF
MSNGIYVAMAGATAQSTALDVAANNIANAGTTGYRAERMKFAQVLTKAKDQAFVRAAAGGTDTSGGQIQETGNPLDVAIRGDGLFAVDSPRGVLYTRAGAFRVDADHKLVNADGLAVRGSDGKPIVVPPDAASLAIGSDGTVEAAGQAIGQLQISRFDPTALQRAGGAMFTATGKPLSGGPAPELVPGAIEGANFNVVRGIVDMVRISRSYESLHRMIESYRDMDDRTARAIGGNG